MSIRLDLLREVLSDLGVDSGALVAFPEVEGGAAYRCEGPGGSRAIEVWRGLRAATEATGAWPVLVASDVDLDRVRAALAHPVSSVGADLAEAEGKDGPDFLVASWHAEQQANLQRYREIDALAELVEELEQSLKAQPLPWSVPDEDPGDWPGAMAPTTEMMVGWDPATEAAATGSTSCCSPPTPGGRPQRGCSSGGSMPARARPCTSRCCAAGRSASGPRWRR